MTKIPLNKYLFPQKLWTQSFTYWWFVSLATVFLFDIFWMLQTTFRPMSYFAFYPVLFLCAFFLASPSLISKNGVFQTVWLLFFDLLFIANLMYCRTYYNAIPLHSYMLAGNLADFQASVFESFKWYFIFLPLLTLAALIFYVTTQKNKKEYPSPLLYFIYVAILSIIIWGGDAWRGGILKRMDFMSEYAYLSSAITPIYSLGGYLVHDYYRSSEKLTSQDKKEVNEWLNIQNDETVKFWNDTTLKVTPPENLILILCESLESWVIEKVVEGKEITPNLNRMLNDSASFYARNVVTQVGSGRSIEGQLLILSGLMPMKNKVYAYDAVENNFFTIPKAMKDRGARSYVLTPDKPYVWNQAMVAPAFGFDTLISASDFILDEETGRTKRLSDGSLMRQVKEKMQKQEVWEKGENVMILIVTNSGHNPFDLPVHLRTISFNGDFPKIIKDYMVTAHYTDSAINNLIEYLKSRPDWKETMVVITGDHEGLATDRRAAMANPVSRQFVDSLQHTPLLILNSPVSGRYDKPLGQVDIYSTLIYLLGLENYPWKGLGRAIFDRDKPQVAIGSTGDIQGDTMGMASDVVRHLKESRSISDKILKFNLLENYPDSI